MRRLHLVLFCLVGLLFSRAGEAGESKPAPHPMIGAWLAEDGTVFRFRADGTFVGIDFRAREIWGNWVAINEQRIGFQSLLSQSYYQPQYAVISAKPDEMDYSYSDRPGFIHAQRITEKDAETIIAEEAKKSVVLPQTATPAP